MLTSAASHIRPKIWAGLGRNRAEAPDKSPGQAGCSGLQRTPGAFCKALYMGSIPIAASRKALLSGYAGQCGGRRFERDPQVAHIPAAVGELVELDGGFFLELEGVAILREYGTRPLRLW